MGENSNPVWITGIGLLSSLGEGTQDHWQAMNAAIPQNVETERFSPYPVHALGEVEWANQISRRDMRQMELWQQIGTYSAGLALDDAGVKNDLDLCGRMDMIVSAGGGERDVEVDASIMTDARDHDDRSTLLTERLSNDLRPTLFLAQLSNLLAGNISIVHKVTGSSRTFMGEEGAGISAIKTAYARIASGQSDIVLVGGAFNGEREDLLLAFELGRYLGRGRSIPVWSRQGDTAGFYPGSAGAFLVLESKSHAEGRKKSPYAELAGVTADHGKRTPELIKKRLDGIFSELDVKDQVSVMSGASGVAEVTSSEKEWLAQKLDSPAVRAYGSLTGHSVEAQFPMGIALAAIAAKNRDFYAPLEELERPVSNVAHDILVTTLGYSRAEGLGLIKSVQNPGDK